MMCSRRCDRRRGQGWTDGVDCDYDRSSWYVYLELTIIEYLSEVDHSYSPIPSDALPHSERALPGPKTENFLESVAKNLLETLPIIFLDVKKYLRRHLQCAHFNGAWRAIDFCLATSGKCPPTSPEFPSESASDLASFFSNKIYLYSKIVDSALYPDYVGSVNHSLTWLKPFADRPLVSTRRGCRKRAVDSTSPFDSRAITVLRSVESLIYR